MIYLSEYIKQLQAIEKEHGDLLIVEIKNYNLYSSKDEIDLVVLKNAKVEVYQDEKIKGRKCPKNEYSNVDYEKCKVVEIKKALWI